MKVLREEIIEGARLLDSGKLVDAYNKPIDPDTKYLVKFHFAKGESLVTILTEEEWHIRDVYDAAREIYSQGGAINWANYGTRLGFYLSPLEAIPLIESFIETFNSVEDYEKSKYLYEELQKLKEYGG